MTNKIATTPEWVSWSHARFQLAASGVCGLTDYPSALGEWAEFGTLDVRAGKLYHNGVLAIDAPVPPPFWRLAKERASAKLYTGELSVNATTENGKRLSVRATNLQVRKDQLDRLAPADAEAMRKTEALADTLESKRGAVASVAAPEKSRAGRKPEKERWQAFYFAVIDLAKDGRLTADHFGSAAALSEEIQLMMGDGAFSADHTKAVVGQIFKRFCGG